MRDNPRCLVCGSNRFAVFRTNNQEQHGLSPKDGFKKIDYHMDYDMLKANEQFKKLLDEGGEDLPKVETDEVKKGSHDEEKSSANPDAAKFEPSVEDIIKALKKSRVSEPTGPPYDKSKSFFDDISCEAKEKASG